jgi:hypothetical protein
MKVMSHPRARNTRLRRETERPHIRSRRPPNREFTLENAAVARILHGKKDRYARLSVLISSEETPHSTPPRPRSRSRPVPTSHLHTSPTTTRHSGPGGRIFPASIAIPVKRGGGENRTGANMRPLHWRVFALPTARPDCDGRDHSDGKSSDPRIHPIEVHRNLNNPKLFPNFIFSWNRDELSVASLQCRKTDHN